jgi:hypothetical protein
MRAVGANHDDMTSCQPANSPQPFRIPCAASNQQGSAVLCDDGPHVLHAWLQHRNRENLMTKIVSQKVVFDVDTAYYVHDQAPELHFLTPRHGDRVWEDSVWLKVEVRPFSHTRLSPWKVCALVDHAHRFCSLDPLQPHQLQNLGVGKHTVTVWLEIVSEDEYLQNTSAAVAQSHTFWINPKDPATAGHLDAELEPVSSSLNELNGPSELLLHDGISPPSINEAPTNPPSYCIIVFAFARPLYLSRLWDTLLMSDFTIRTDPVMSATVDMKLIIDRPSPAGSTSASTSEAEQHAAVLALAERLQWPHGKFNIVRRERHYGIRDNVLSSWLPGRDSHKDRAIFLEDDVVVSPYFFQWLLAAERARGVSAQNWGGVSLYRPKWNEIRWTPFDDHEGPMLLQLPCSWGAMYTSSFWFQFIRWWNHVQHQRTPRRLHLPRSLANAWGASSWKQALLRYMVEEDAYLLYPSKAFSSTGAPNGVHVKNSKALKQLFDVPLVVSKQKAAQAIFSLFYYQSNRSDGGGGGDNDGTERAAIIPEFDYQVENHLHHHLRLEFQRHLWCFCRRQEKQTQDCCCCCC